MNSVTFTFYPVTKGHKAVEGSGVLHPLLLTGWTRRVWMRGHSFILPCVNRERWGEL